MYDLTVSVLVRRYTTCIVSMHAREPISRRQQKNVEYTNTSTRVMIDRQRSRICTSTIGTYVYWYIHAYSRF